MSATLHVNNGRERKSLASQIDRLDSLLDGLAENLNEAVASAVTEAVGAAVRQAVTAALSEVLTHPHFLAALRAQVQPAKKAAARPRTSIWLLAVTGVASLGRLLWGLTRTTVQHGQRLPQTTHQAVRGTGRLGLWLLRRLRPFQVPLLAALGFGGAVGTAAFFAEPWLAAALSGVGGFTTALAVYAGMLLRQLMQLPSQGHA